MSVTVPAVMSQVHQRICPRCRTPVRPGRRVCEYCEQPLDGPVALRYNPAGLALPSPIQGHATVLVAVIAGVILLISGAWFLYHGVGPFHAQAVSQAKQADGSLLIELRVANDGSRAGKARCQVSGVKPDGTLLNSAVQLSPTVPGHQQVTFTLRADGKANAHDVSATCA